jgi:hypothetical protein
MLAIAGGIMRLVHPDTVSVGGVAHHVSRRSTERAHDR